MILRELLTDNANNATELVISENGKVIYWSQKPIARSVMVVAESNYERIFA